MNYVRFADDSDEELQAKYEDALRHGLRLRTLLTEAREALERIAHHDGDRWDWDTRELGDVFGVSVERKPSPQEIAQEALATPVEGDE